MTSQNQKKTIELSTRTRELMAEFLPIPPKTKFPKKEKLNQRKKTNTTTSSNSLIRSKSAVLSKKLGKNFVPDIPTKITADMDLVGGYFDCMNTCCRNKVGGNITRKAQLCSLKKSVFAQQRVEELSKLINAYGQMGVSLGKLLNRNFGERNK